MIAVMPIRMRKVHVVVSIVSCASVGELGYFLSFDFVYLWGVSIVCFSLLERRCELIRNRFSCLSVRRVPR